MSESGVKNAVAQRVVRPHELPQWHRNWNGTPNRKVLRQHNIETAIEYLPRPRQWLSPLSASPAKMRAFYLGDDKACLWARCSWTMGSMSLDLITTPRTTQSETVAPVHFPEFGREGLQMGPRATESFRAPPFQRAVRPAPAASGLQLAPPVGLLTGVGEGVQNFSVLLHETDPCQVR